MHSDLIFNFPDLFPIFSVLDENEKNQLRRIVNFTIVKKYNFIYTAGDPSDYVYFLSKGAIKKSVFSEDGREIIKSLLHPKAIFGELGIVGEKERPDFAQVLKSEAHVYSIKTSDIKRLMQQNHRFTIEIMSLFGKRVIQTETKLESLVFKDARARIIDFIKDSIKKQGRRIGFEMLLKHPLTHQDMANLTCTSRQTVTLVLNELRKSNLIHFNRGRILVRDMAKLI